MAPSARALEADILEFLSLYQYCLLILLRYTMRAAGLVDESETVGDLHCTSTSTGVFDSYESTLKNLFSRYLLCWRDCSCNCSCCISDTFMKPATSSTYRRPRARYCMCDSSPTTATTTNTIASTSSSSQKQQYGSVNKFKVYINMLVYSLFIL